MPDSTDCFNSNKDVLKNYLDGLDSINKEDFIEKYVELFFKILEVTDETCNIEPRHNYNLVIKTKNKDQYKLTNEILEKILLLKLKEKT